MKGEEAGTAPGLTVVIPTLGRETLLSTVRSLLAAKGSERIEIVVAGKVSAPEIADELQRLYAANQGLRHLPVQYDSGDSSEKKNAGWRSARAPLIAFLDDDVVVAPDWPLRILEAFESAEVDVVSGPGLVPPDVGLFARLAGVVLASPATGYVAWRYRHGTSNLIPVKWSKIIGCNMAFRKTVLEAIGGFDPAFWPGEEMIASFRSQQQGHQLMFFSPAYVFHYPRQSLARFCRQIFGYGSTRIRLIRAGVEFEPTTLVPAIWVAVLFGGMIVSPFSSILLIGWLTILGAYVAVAAGIAIRMTLESRKPLDLLCFFLIPVCHLCYGIAGWWELLHPNKDLSVSAGKDG